MNIKELASKGGKARAAKLSREQRQAIGRKAANTRWGNNPPPFVVPGDIGTEGDREARRAAFEARVWNPFAGLLCGPYPGEFAQMMANSCHTFICLQQPDETNYQGERFWDYTQTLQSWAKFKRFPILDMSVPHSPYWGRKIVKAVLDALASPVRLENGVWIPQVYLHCWGGHGRTGTIVGCLLRQMGYNTTQALGMIQKARDMQPALRSHASPQTHAQREFIADYIPTTL